MVTREAGNIVISINQHPQKNVSFHVVFFTINNNILAILQEARLQPLLQKDCHNLDLSFWVF